MQRLADVTLILLQWTLVVLGLLTVLVTLDETYRTLRRVNAPVPEHLVEETYYVVLHFRSVLLDIVSGLIAMGLGAVLFYLRRSNLARRGS